MLDNSLNQPAPDAWQQATGADGAKRFIVVAMVAGVPVSFVPVPTYQVAQQWPDATPSDLHPDALQRLANHMAIVCGKPDSADAAVYSIARLHAGAAAITACNGVTLQTVSGASIGCQVQPVSFADIVNPWHGISAQNEADLMTRAFERFTLSGETGYDHNAGELLKLFCKCNPKIDAATIDNLLQLARAIMAYDSKTAIGERINRLAIAESFSYFLTGSGKGATND